MPESEVTSEGRQVVQSPLMPFIDASGWRTRARFQTTPELPGILPVQTRLLAGAAEVDITPPPGMPKAGYSANAHSGTGFRTRLRARVLHLRAGTASVALVQCDLLGGSAVVQHLVAQAIREQTDVPLAGLLIGATHTHAGPGQFLGTDFYNRFASNKSGFDPAFAQFLVDSISAAVIEAVRTRRPAAAAIGSVGVWGLTRNRSMAAHVRNRNAVDTRTTPERKFLAINPELHVLRVDSVESGESADIGPASRAREHPGPSDKDQHASTRTGRSSPLAGVVVFSVHGTGVPMQADEYNADIWAYLVGELGNRVEARYGTRPIIGAIEGTHADVAPAIRPGAAGHIEAARVGRAIGESAAELFASLENELTEEVELQSGFREIDLEKDSSIDGVTLAPRPAVGAALLAGAHENETPVICHVPPFRADNPKPWPGRLGSAHAEKWVLGSRWLQPVVLPLRSFPRILPIQTVRIGDTMLVGLPFEITVETGRRIAGAVSDALDPAPQDSTVDSGVQRVVISSVANEYSGYVASPEEYQQQRYEGAHTLYGPKTQPFLARHVVQLAVETVRSDVVQDAVPVRRFDLRITRHLLRADSEGPEVPRRILEYPTYHDASSATDGYWKVEWLDVDPARLVWNEALVAVQGCDGDGIWSPVADDQGWDMQVTHLGAAAGAGHRYEARWWDPEFRGTSRFRFVILSNAGRPEIVSPPFP